MNSICFVSATLPIVMPCAITPGELSGDHCLLAFRIFASELRHNATANKIFFRTQIIWRKTVQQMPKYTLFTLSKQQQQYFSKKILHSKIYKRGGSSFGLKNTQFQMKSLVQKIWFHFFKFCVNTRVFPKISYVQFQKH